MDSQQSPSPACTNCGSPEVHTTRVRSAFWHDDRLVVVEDIPTIVCVTCGEQFYDDETVVGLDLLRGGGFPAEDARAELRVPVFSFGAGAAEKAES